MTSILCYAILNFVQSQQRLVLMLYMIIAHNITEEYLMATIVLEVMQNDKNMVDELMANHPQDIQVLNSRRFQGEPETIQLLIELSSFIIPSIASVIVAYIHSKKHISIKYKGLEVKGISESTVIEVLEKLNDGKTEK